MTKKIIGATQDFIKSITKAITAFDKAVDSERIKTGIAKAKLLKTKTPASTSVMSANI